MSTDSNNNNNNQGVESNNGIEPEVVRTAVFVSCGIALKPLLMMPINEILENKQVIPGETMEMVEATKTYLRTMLPLMAKDSERMIPGSGQLFFTHLHNLEHPDEPPKKVTNEEVEKIVSNGLKSKLPQLTVLGKMVEA